MLAALCCAALTALHFCGTAGRLAHLFKLLSEQGQESQSQALLCGLQARACSTGFSRLDMPS